MRKTMKTIILTLLAGIVFSGCSIPFTDNGTETSEAAGSGSTIVNSMITSEEDERVKSLVNDFFSCLYSEPVENYSNYSISGNIPPKIKDFVSKSTVALAEGNPEIGIHLPRYVEMNGLTAIGYEIIKNKGEDGRDVPWIDAGFTGTRGDSVFYYAKINLAAKCLNSGIFESLYSLDNQTGMWRKNDTQPVDEGLVDYVRVQARYDVEMKKEEGNYKIVTVKEACTEDGLKNRLYTWNNDFISRFPYLNIAKTDDGKNYINESDGKVYEEEKAVILSFFNSLKESLNMENMKLLYTKWNTDAAGFSEFLDKIGQPGEGSTKKLCELMDINDEYRSRFDYESLPLQPNMERLDGAFKSFAAELHPGYTKKQKKYIVTFEVPVRKINGMIEGEECVYRYDYTVALTKVNEVLKVSGIKLDECSKVEDKPQ